LARCVLVVVARAVRTTTPVGRLRVVVVGGTADVLVVERSLVRCSFVASAT
jgi:hypothetical protein